MQAYEQSSLASHSLIGKQEHSTPTEVFHVVAVNASCQFLIKCLQCLKWFKINCFILFSLSRKLLEKKKSEAGLQGVTGEWFEEIQRKKFQNNIDVNTMLKPPLEHQLRNSKKNHKEFKMSSCTNPQAQKNTSTSFLGFRSPFAWLFSFRKSRKTQIQKQPRAYINWQQTAFQDDFKYSDPADGNSHLRSSRLPSVSFGRSSEGSLYPPSITQNSGFRHKSYMDRGTAGRSYSVCSLRRCPSSVSSDQLSASSLQCPLARENNNGFVPRFGRQNPKRIPLSSIVWNNTPDSPGQRSTQEKMFRTQSLMEFHATDHGRYPRSLQENEKYACYHSKHHYRRSISSSNCFSRISCPDKATSPLSFDNWENCPFYQSESNLSRSYFRDISSHGKLYSNHKNSPYGKTESYLSWTDIPQYYNDNVFISPDTRFEVMMANLNDQQLAYTRNSKFASQHLQSDFHMCSPENMNIKTLTRSASRAFSEFTEGHQPWLSCNSVVSSVVRTTLNVAASNREKHYPSPLTRSPNDLTSSSTSVELTDRCKHLSKRESSVFSDCKERGNYLQKYKTTSTFTVCVDEDHVKYHELVSIYYTLPRRHSKTFCNLFRDNAEDADLSLPGENSQSPRIRKKKSEGHVSLADVFFPSPLEKEVPSCSSDQAPSAPVIPQNVESVAHREEENSHLSPDSEKVCTSKSVSMVNSRNDSSTDLSSTDHVLSDVATKDVSLSGPQPIAVMANLGNSLSDASNNQNTETYRKEKKEISQTATPRTSTLPIPSKPGRPSENRFYSASTSKNSIQKGNSANCSQPAPVSTNKNQNSLLLHMREKGSRGRIHTECADVPLPSGEDKGRGSTKVKQGVNFPHQPTPLYNNRSSRLQLRASSSRNNANNVSSCSKTSSESQKKAFEVSTNVENENKLLSDSTRDKIKDIEKRKNRPSIKNKLAAVCKTSRKFSSKNLPPKPHINNIFSQNDGNATCLEVSMSPDSLISPDCHQSLLQSETENQNDSPDSDKNTQIPKPAEISKSENVNNPSLLVNNLNWRSLKSYYTQKEAISSKKPTAKVENRPSLTTQSPDKVLATRNKNSQTPDLRLENTSQPISPSATALDPTDDEKRRASSSACTLPLPLLTDKNSNTFISNCLQADICPKQNLTSQAGLTERQNASESNSLRNANLHSQLLRKACVKNEHEHHFSESICAQDSHETFASGSNILPKDSVHGKRCKSYSEVLSCDENENWALDEERCYSTRNLMYPSVEFGIFGKEQQLAFLENIKRSLTEGRLWKPCLLNNPSAFRDGETPSINRTELFSSSSAGSKVSSAASSPQELPDIYQDDPAAYSDSDSDTTTDDEYYLDEIDKESEL
uniref:Exophilin 5 n=1 Tax=Meleagris gallopavo TaxID=9103 RepID=G1NQH1_MELGA